MRRDGHDHARSPSGVDQGAREQGDPSIRQRDLNAPSHEVHRLDLVAQPSPMLLDQPFPPDAPDQELLVLVMPYDERSHASGPKRS